MNRCTVETLENRVMLAGTPVVSMDGGDTLATPTVLGRLAGPLAVKNGFASGEQVDYFSFSVRWKGSVNLSLSGMTTDANLRLYDSSGKSLGKSFYPGTASDWLTRRLSRGTYIVEVTRGGAAADGVYTLNLQADLNYQNVDIDGDDADVSLTRTDGSTTAISPTRETWIVIHGWLGSPDNIHGLAKAIDAGSRRDQVLELDWSDSASHWNPITVNGRVPDVAKWVVSQLKLWGVSGANVNLVGHSMGGWMTDEIARRVSGGVDRIVALDPATPSLLGIDTSDTDFSDHSKFSVAFLGSNFGTAGATFTADEAIALDVGSWSSLGTHTNVQRIFQTMTEINNTTSRDRISPLFSLSSLHSATRPDFKPDSVSGRYEALLTGSVSNGRLNPGVLDYISNSSGQWIKMYA